MELGVNTNGYRWTVEDEGYVAKLWREGQTTAIAGREQFSTREGRRVLARADRGLAS